MLLAEPSGEQLLAMYIHLQDERNILPEPRETRIFSGSGCAGLPASLGPLGMVFSYKLLKGA